MTKSTRKVIPFCTSAHRLSLHVDTRFMCFSIRLTWSPVCVDWNGEIRPKEGFSARVPLEPDPNMVLRRSFFPLLRYRFSLVLPLSLGSVPGPGPKTWGSCLPDNSSCWTASNHWDKDHLKTSGSGFSVHWCYVRYINIEDKTGHIYMITQSCPWKYFSYCLLIKFEKQLLSDE